MNQRTQHLFSPPTIEGLEQHSPTRLPRISHAQTIARQTFAFSIPDFCRSHGISRAHFYNLWKSGDAPTVMRVGRRSLISTEAARALVGRTAVLGSECARLEHPTKGVRSITNSHRKEITVRNNQQIQRATTPTAQAESPTTPITYPVGRLGNARILRLKQVVTTVGLAKSSIYRKIQIGTFPPPIKLGGARASGWLSTEVLEWIEDQVRRRPKAERSREL